MTKSAQTVTVEQIDALLPQTQCGLCDQGGCLPYAEAIAQGDTINRCPPGGVPILLQLAELTQQDAAPYIEDMQAKAKPAMRVVIREDECIGCTKCIQACPVDAILGSGKLMHTVIAEECTGCELCIEPCPVDCIDLVAVEPSDMIQQKTHATHYRQRYQARQARLLRDDMEQAARRRQARLKQTDREQTIAARRAAIAAARQRVAAKRNG